MNPILPTLTLFALPLALPSISAAGQQAVSPDRLCDTSFEDCRAPIITLINQENAAIDVAFWYVTDSRYITALINAHKRGAKVRVLWDPQAVRPDMPTLIERLRAAGIPMRQRNKEQPGILHWKFMHFEGQKTFYTSAANLDPYSYLPSEPYVNYMDEVIFISGDERLRAAWKTRFDDKWIHPSWFTNYSNAATPKRSYPVVSRTTAPELNDEKVDGFIPRMLSYVNAEQTAMDIIIYRFTDQTLGNAILAALGRGVHVRMITEASSYSSSNYGPKMRPIIDAIARHPNAQVKMRLHAGLTHQKFVRFYSQNIWGHLSNNWGNANPQHENNIFSGRESFRQFFPQHFERKWLSTAEFKPF